MHLVSPIITLLVLAKSISPAIGHELWISPDNYQLSLDKPLTAHIRIGEKFEGPSFPFVEMNFERFEIADATTSFKVAGRLGDAPALNQKAKNAGLNVILYETTANSVTYTDLEKFRNFVTHKGYPEIIDDHIGRGLPQSGFKERYFRYAKSLIAVEDGEGTDQKLGLEIEIVALENPYKADLSAGLPVQVFYQDKPHANAQVEIFERAGSSITSAEDELTGKVEISILETDLNGKVNIPVRQGYEYLVDSVVIRPVEPPTSATGNSNPAVWESLWASMTFEIPVAD
ncbi:MAG: DUF4198 domain-containing protein [Pseudomonadota bacterium]